MRKTTLAALLVSLLVLALSPLALGPVARVFAGAVGASGHDSVTALAPADPPAAGAGVPTAPNLKVAFIGDVGRGASQQAVLRLIKSEGAQAVLHQGDFDYEHDPAQFWASVDNVLGPNFPYFVSVGNHDIKAWSTTAQPSYAQFQLDRLARIGITPDQRELNDEMYSIVFKGLKVVFVGQEKDAGDRAHAPYIRSQLASDDHVWRVCSWHRNMTAMQVGNKHDEMGWGVYETCRELGAVIATAHEHSYERTKTLNSIRDQTVDPQSPNPDHLTVAPGRTFVFVSGLGGESVRPQRRCLPTSPPYGCNGEWAKIYTSSQGAQYGALFITFTVNGDPNKASGYFKNIQGQIVDQFDITKK